MKIYGKLLTLFLLLPLHAHASEISVDNAWIRAMPHNITTLGGYMTIHNDSDKQIKLIAASSPKFSDVEFHATIAHNKNVLMRPIRAMKVPARDALHLSPRSRHLMLLNADKPLKRGEEVELTLEFDNGEKHKVVATVRMDAPKSHHHDNIDRHEKNHHQHNHTDGHKHTH